MKETMISIEKAVLRPVSAYPHHLTRRQTDGNWGLTFSPDLST